MDARRVARRTVVAMLACTETGSTFGIFQARVRGRCSWNIDRARRVGTVTLDPGAPWPSYQALAERFATAEWPALDYPPPRAHGGLRSHT